MHSLKVALVQMEIALGQSETNIQSARRLLVQARERGAELVLLPELWSTGYDLEHAGQHASELQEGIFLELSSMAREFALHLCGSVLENRDGRYFNTQTIHGPSGQLLASYSKIHLFGLMHEPEFLGPGNRLSLVQLPWGAAGMSVCYDLRFPEMFRAYALGGAQVILLSAEWPHPRLEHWRTLLCARAIENQCYVVACNCVGESKGNIFFGHSMVIDPWGEVLVEGDEREAVLVAEIDTARADEIRRRFPFFADRRVDLYWLS